jgi:hypothetical protein
MEKNLQAYLLMEEVMVRVCSHFPMAQNTGVKVKITCLTVKVSWSLVTVLAIRVSLSTAVQQAAADSIFLTVPAMKVILLKVCLTAKGL